MSAVSPGTIAVFQPNEFYPSHAAYIEALANAMRPEYEMIVKSGLVLQIDCPDLGMGRHIRFRDVDDDEFVRNAHLQVEALNHAIAGLAGGSHPHAHLLGQLRRPAHARHPALQGAARVAQGEADGPAHRRREPAARARVGAVQDAQAPGRPGARSRRARHHLRTSSSTPSSSRNASIRYAELVGRERVLAGTDCGFGHFAGFGAVHPVDLLGEDAVARRRRAHRHEEALELTAYR